MILDNRLIVQAVNNLSTYIHTKNSAISETQKSEVYTLCIKSTYNQGEKIIYTLEKSVIQSIIYNSNT